MAVNAGVSFFDAVFLVAGGFDRPAASRLCERLEELPHDAHVLLDFTHARDVSDLALAALAATFAARGGPLVALRGLTHHQARLLQYLGIGGFVLDSDARGDPPSA